MKRFGLIITLTVCCLVLFSLKSSADNAVKSDTLKSLAAYRLTSEIKLDGFLDEPDWGKAEAATGFRQTDPKQGDPGTERTEAKILYAEDAVYVGFWCYDSEPDKIIRQLTRRDRYTDADYVTVRFDSYHDHQTAYYFNLNASGVKRDMRFYNNDWSDLDWDAVWDGKVRLTSQGWTAEFRIPYTALRFVDEEEHTWGLDFSRYIPRKSEMQRWQFVASAETGGVARYGHLTGLKGIHSPSRVETLPYFVSYGTHEPDSKGNPDGNSTFSNVGGDLKYSLSSSFDLNATINPDFGQVEFDGATVNLGVFETWYPEKRPFFLEGNDIFAMPYFEQFYSRRIGRTPSGSPNDPQLDYTLERPSNTTILGAVKLNGRTSGGTSIGLLNATTQEERMTYRREDDPESVYEAVIEPMANYSVARVKQDIGNSSYVGGMLTGAIQDGTDDAFTGSIDWQIYNKTRQYKFEGMAVGNSNETGPIGGAYYAGLSKETGKFHRGNILADFYSKNHNLNRLGSSTTTDYWGAATWQQLYTNKGWGPARYAQINFNGHYNRLATGERFSNGWNLNGYLLFKNNWGTSYGYSGTGSRYDPYETRGRGLWLRPGGHSAWGNIWTDAAKPVQIEYYIENWNSLDGGGNYHSIWMNLKPVDRLEFSVGMSFNKSDNQLYWTGVVDAVTTDSAQLDRAVFGRLDREKISLNTRGLYSFTRDLTLQWAAEFYFDAGDFDDYQVLTDPSTLEDASVGTSMDIQRPDYNYKSLQANMVLRWEFRPGSSAYLVWTHNRDLYATDHGDLDFSRDMGDLFALPQTNSVLLKVNYWWNI